jgi:hypothetical protein
LAHGTQLGSARLGLEARQKYEQGEVFAALEM